MTWHRPPRREDARHRRPACPRTASVRPAARRRRDRPAARVPAPAARAWLRRPRIAGATAPTCEAIRRSRRAWNASPSGSGRRARRRTSSPRRCAPRRRRDASARRSPASLAEACTISSCSRGAASGAAKRAAEALRQRRARRVDVHHGHARGRDARQQRGGQQPDHAGADHQHPLAGERRGIPQHVQRGFHVRGQHGARASAPRRAPGCTSRRARGRRPGADAARRRAGRPSARGRPRCSRISPGTGTRRPSAARASPAYWLGGTRPANTSASVPRDTPLASVRTSDLVRRRAAATVSRADLAAARARRSRTRAPRSRRARLGRARASGMSNSRSAPSRCTDQSKRSPSVSAPLRGRVKAGMPEPSSSGAIVTCSRSSAPAARKRETVMPPPSTKIRRSPRAASAASTAAMSSPSPRARQAQHRRLAEAVVARRIGGAEQQRRRAVAEHAVVARPAGGRCPAPRAPARGLRPRAWSAADRRRAPCRRRPRRHRHSARSRWVCTMSSLPADPVRGAAGRSRCGRPATGRCGRARSSRRPRSVERAAGRRAATEPASAGCTAQQAAPGLRGQRVHAPAVSRRRSTPRVSR